MRAMILAAGRGDRMGTLTANTPKPLLRVAGKYLIEHAIDRLRQANIDEIVINVSYHAVQLKAALGDGQKYGISLVYSEEKERLETGGGILQALPLLGPDPFLVISGDIITDFPLQKLTFASLTLAHLVLVDNPSYHPQGDFGLREGKIDLLSTPKFTFANIGIYHPQLFTGFSHGHFRLSEVLFPAIKKDQISGELFRGTWYNIGTPQDIAEINRLKSVEIS